MGQSDIADLFMMTGLEQGSAIGMSAADQRRYLNLIIFYAKEILKPNEKTSPNEMRLAFYRQVRYLENQWIKKRVTCLTEQNAFCMLENWIENLIVHIIA